MFRTLPQIMVSGYINPFTTHLKRTDLQKCYCNSDKKMFQKQQQYLHIERYKGNKAVVLYDLCQFLIQLVKFFKEGVSSQVVEEVGEVHDLCVEVKVEGCMGNQTGTLTWQT